MTTLARLKKHPVVVASSVLAAILALFVAVTRFDDRYAKAEALAKARSDLEATVKKGMEETEQGVRLTHLTTQEQGYQVQQILLEQNLKSATRRHDEAEVAALNRKLDVLATRLNMVLDEKRELRRGLGPRAMTLDEDLVLGSVVNSRNVPTAPIAPPAAPEPPPVMHTVEIQAVPAPVADPSEELQSEDE